MLQDTNKGATATIEMAETGSKTWTTKLKLATNLLSPTVRETGATNNVKVPAFTRQKISTFK